MSDPITTNEVSIESLMGEVMEEFRARLDHGEHPDIDEYATKYPRVADALRFVLPTLLEARAAAADDSKVSLSPGVAEQLHGQLGDYHIVREVGRGGMGVVYEAEQISLGRRVALKVLPFAAVLDAKQLQRFKNEAQAAAHLQHQNIVPVYAVGCERGVHYYAMQFIEGSTLGDVIHELRQLESPDAPGSVGPPRQTSAGDSAARSRSTSDTDDADTPDSDAARLTDARTVANGSSAALDAFAPERSTKSPAFFRSVANLGVQAAEALEHAHEFGIVHRDIKPSNLLLDQRGNLWITDFGLARLESSPDLTMTGDILGTLRYMSPEQAAGKNLLLDHRTDIYSLGVTLYELLTLRPAIDGRDRQELLKQIADHDPRPPRRLNPAIPPDLETIVLKATAKEPHRRYATAKELAKDLDRFLDDKPIRAKRPTLMERAAKWSRRHRHLVASAVVVLVVAVSALSISTVLLAQKQAEIVRQRNAARVQSTRAETARGREREQRELAEQRQKETEQVSEFQAAMLSEIDVEAMGRGIKEHFREQVRAALERQYVGEFPDRRKRTPEEIEAELAAFDQRADAAQAADVARRVMDEFVLARAADALEKEFADQPLVRAQLHLAIGRTYWKLGLYDAAEPHLRTALEIRQGELGDEHSDTLTSIHNMGFLLRAQGRLADAEPYLRKALEGRRRVLGDEQRNTLASINEMGLLLQDQGKHSEAEPYVREALEGYRRVLGDDDPNTLSSISNMGLLLDAQGKPAEAEPYCREALEGRRRVLGDEHPATLISIDNMGSVLQAQGRLAEAEPYYREALDGFRRVLGNEHADTLTAINNMGNLLKAQRRLDEAEPYHREALEGRRRVLGDEHPSTLASISNMGDLLHYQGKLAEAEPYYREALEESRRILGDEHPDTLISLNNMAYLVRDQGRRAEALSLFAEGTRAARAGLGDHPVTAVIEHHYADVLLKVGRRDEALELAQGAVDRYRAHPDWSPREAAHAHSVLARALVAAGRLAEAEPHYREALAGNRRVLGDEDPTTLSYSYAVGFLLVDLGRPAEAEPYFREALEGRRRVLGEEDPATLAAINEMAFVLQAQGKYAEAEPYYRGALEINRRVQGDEHSATLTSIHNMGYWLSAQGKPAEAELYYREALETGRRVLGDDHPDLFPSIHAMGSVLRAQGKLAEAEPYFRDVLEKCRRVLGDKDPGTLRSLNGMGGLLQDQRKPAEAEAYFREALETGRRVLGDEHPITLASINSMGMLLRDLGRLSEAESLFADGTRAARAGLGDHPTTGAIEHHYADVLREAGRVDEAIDLAQTAVDRYRAHPDWPPDEAAHAREVLAEALLDVGDQAFLEQAEEAARKSLEIRRTVLPEDHPRVWLRYNAMSMLGEVLVARAADPSAAIGARIEKLREAEPLLLEAWENLKDDPNVPPPSATGGISRTRSALERIVRLYDEWHAAEPDAGYEAKAAEWRTELEKLDGC